MKTSVDFCFFERSFFSFLTLVFLFRISIFAITYSLMIILLFYRVLFIKAIQMNFPRVVVEFSSRGFSDNYVRTVNFPREGNLHIRSNSLNNVVCRKLLTL